MEEWFHAFITSVLDGGERSASFTWREKIYHYPLGGCRVGPREYLDAIGKEKIFVPVWI
jgi:hypothetical protein